MIFVAAATIAQSNELSLKADGPSPSAQQRLPIVETRRNNQLRERPHDIDYNQSTPKLSIRGGQMLLTLTCLVNGDQYVGYLSIAEELEGGVGEILLNPR